MSKFSKILKISLSFVFIVIFALLSVSFFTEKIPGLNIHEKKLRKLGAETVFFTIFSVFDYFFYPFLLVTFFAPCIYCCKDENIPENNIETKRWGFIFNNICYIINICYMITSGVNFINDFQYGYSLSIFIFASIYFLVRSIIYIIMSFSRDICFPGICEWKYIGMMFSTACCYFAPCNDEECKRMWTCQEGCEDVPCCCICCLSSIGIFYYVTNFFTYYIGLLFYTFFWLIGKFFVFISCCDCCWCKEEYDMSFLRFNGTSDTPLNIPEDVDIKEAKKEIDKEIKKAKKEINKEIKKEKKEIDKEIKKEKKAIFNFSKNFFKGIKKSLKEDEKKDSK